MVILPLRWSRILSHYRAYVSHAWPKIICLNPDCAKKRGMGMMIPWPLRGMDCATFIELDQFPSAVIIFQSARLQLMFNSLATSSFIAQISDRPSMSMGSSHPSILSRTVVESMPFWTAVYPVWSPRPERAVTWAILILVGVAGLQAATWLSVGTETILAFVNSRKVNSPVSLSWRPGCYRGASTYVTMLITKYP